MAKVLISPLGSGRLNRKSEEREYVPANYKFNDSEQEYETTFVTAALAEHLQIDKVLLLGTSGSMWDEVYNYYTEHSYNAVDMDYWLELVDKKENSSYGDPKIKKDDLDKVDTAIDNFLAEVNPNSQGGSKAVLIDYGAKEEELWNNFDIFMELSEELEDGDEVYLDITHSFRSIPIFMYLMMEFIQDLKEENIELAGLYYGMLEVKGDLDYAPVVDLKPFFEISQWIRGIYNFTNFGSGYLISNLIEEEEVSKRINNISNLININYLFDLRQQIDKLRELLTDDSLRELRFLAPLMPRLKGFVDRFKDVSSEGEFQREIAKWYFENKRYSNGYICLLESVLTSLCEGYSLDSTKTNNRYLVKTIVASKSLRKNANKLSKSAKNLLEKLADKYNAINDIRISIAHASHTSNPGSFANDIKQTLKYYNEIKSYFNSKEIEEIYNKLSLDLVKKYKK